MAKCNKTLAPIHPGEILLEEFLIPLKITQYRLAKDIKVVVTRIAEIIKCKRAITADTALRLSHYFGLSKTYCLGLQKQYELDVAEDALADTLTKEITPFAADDAA